MNEGNTAQRLKNLLQIAKGMPRSTDGNFGNHGNAAVAANYSNALNAINDTTRNIVICSDFPDSDNFSESIKQWQSNNPDIILSCWRFLKKYNARVRKATTKL